ncbi:MAG: DegT/DnrJ/EryC1/StrS family aminotransferase [Chloroflexota bacterium]
MHNNYFPANGHLFYFWKGRVALYTILRALGLGPGDEVIVPGFTCVVVPNAILYLGAKPIYADIEPATYNLSAATVAPLITGRSRVIIVQNTFGLSVDLDPLLELAQHHNLVVVEDCAHGLGGFYKYRPNGTIAHAAFFSSQWSKPISTGLGGAAYTVDPALARSIERVMGDMKMPRPGLGRQTILAAQLMARPLADQPLLHYLLVGAYRCLTQKLGLSVGSSTPSELNSVTMPPGYAKRMGPLQRQGWQRSLAGLAQKVAQRQAAISRYDEFLAVTSLKPPYRPAYAEHAMLRYAVRVPDKEHFLARARDLHIPVGDWFVSPLHPVTGDLNQWGYQAGQCPAAEQACREVVNLLTDRPLSQQQLEVLFDRTLSLAARRQVYAA